MKKGISKLSIISLVVVALIVGAAASGLTGNFFSRLTAARGTFGVGYSLSAPDLLKVDVVNVDQGIEFPYVNTQDLRLGECGIWTDGSASAGRSAHYVVEKNDTETTEDVPLLFKLRIEGPEAEKAAEALVVGVEITGTKDNSCEYVISANTNNWSKQDDGSVVTPEFYFGTIDNHTTGDLGFAFMSAAKEPIEGEYNITVDIGPAPTPIGATGVADPG